MFFFLTQYEGISYLPASVENHDHLLEELYWIAKTTVRLFFLEHCHSAKSLGHSITYVIIKLVFVARHLIIKSPLMSHQKDF